MALGETERCLLKCVVADRAVPFSAGPAGATFRLGLTYWILWHELVLCVMLLDT